MKNEFELALNEILESRALSREEVQEAVANALISAYRKDANASQSQRVEAEFDLGTGRTRIFVEKEVVEEVQSLHTEVELEKARYYHPEANLGDVVMVQVEGTTKKFGRIAAQTAKQVMLQRIREAERDSLYNEYRDREGDLITGTVQSVSSQQVTLSLGRVEAQMPRGHQMPNERYKAHDKVRTYVVEVKKSTRGPQIIVSRAHKDMLRRLLEYEVPEIFNGQVEIKNIAREAGHRSKVAVAALQDGVDPVGACVGMRGMRIQNIVKELNEEKIDVIEWSQDQSVFIAKSLSPARVSGVYLEDDIDNGRTAVVIVPDDQLSLAIGREGQNARLAAKLTGWRIDIKSVTEAVQEALAKIDVPPLNDLVVRYSDMVADVRRILDKKLTNRAVMPEEYQMLAKFADLAETRQLTAREDVRKARMSKINAVRATLPMGSFQTPVSALDLPPEYITALEPMGSVGEIMWRFLLGEDGRLRQLLKGLPENAGAVIQEALDKVVIPDFVQPEEAVVEVEPEAEPVEAAAALVAAPEVVDEDEEVRDAFIDDAPAPTQLPEPPVLAPYDPRRAPVRKAVADAPVEDEEETDDEDIDSVIGGKPGVGKEDKTKKKKERQQRRQLIFDEEIGEVVAKRRRKGGRGSDDWDDYLG